MSKTVQKIVLIALLIAVLISSFGCTVIDTDINQSDEIREAIKDLTRKADTEETTDNNSEEETQITESSPGRDTLILGNDLLNFDYSQVDYCQCKEKLTELSEIIRCGDVSDEEFMRMYNRFFENEYARLEKAFMSAMVKVMTILNEGKYSEEYSEYSRMYNETDMKCKKMYREIYESRYRKMFFDGWKDEDVVLALKIADSYTEKLAELNVKSEEVKNQYYSIIGSSDFMQRSSELFLEAVKINNELAHEAGYDNYLDYAYEQVYQRDYTPKDVEKIAEFIESYIVPAVYDAYEKMSDSYKLLSKDEIENAEKFTDGNISLLNIREIYGDAAEETEVSRVFGAYLDALGGEFAKSYRELWRNGNYIMGTDPKMHNNTAFTGYVKLDGDPVMYIGPGYDNVRTFVHEFGHYYSFYLSGSEDVSYDIAEIHSQSCEWLYVAYLSDVLSENQYNYLKYSYLINDLLSIVRCLSVDRFEYRVYSSEEELTPDSLDGIMREVMETIGVYDVMSHFNSNPLTYWHYVAIDNPGYYISYSVSMLPTLVLFDEAENNFQTAVEKYQKLEKFERFDKLEEKLKDAGIESVFDEKTYRIIAELTENKR